MSAAWCQMQVGELSGVVVDDSNKVANNTHVNLMRDKSIIRSTTTDVEGRFYFMQIPAGEYQLVAYKDGYSKTDLTRVSILTNQPNNIELQIFPISIVMKDVAIIRPPIKGKITTPTTQVIRQEILEQLKDPTSTINIVTGGVRTKDGVTVGGTRPEATQTTVNGSPQSSGSIIMLLTSQVAANTIGLPASMGDLTGGQIAFTSKMPSERRTGQLQVMSSSFTDPYHYNHIEGILRGPLLWKQIDSIKRKMILGYTLAGNYIHRLDANPAFGGVWQLRQEQMDQLKLHPMIVSPNGQSMINRAETYTYDDFVKVKVRPSNNRDNMSFNGKLVYEPNDKFTASIEGNISKQISQGTGYGQSLYNSENPARRTFDERIFIFNFTHNIKKFNYKDSMSLLASLNYSVRFNYLNQHNLTEDSRHGDQFFNYGYLGKYITGKNTTYKTVDLGFQSSKAFNTTSPYTGNDTVVYLRNYIEQQAQEDTGLVYIPGTINEMRSRYTSDVMDQFHVKNITELQSRNGLRNGDDPTSVYGMWSNIGAPNAQYSKSNLDLYNLYVVGDAKLRNRQIRNSFHDIQFGMQFEQRVYRGYSLNATDLWGMMRQLAVQSQPVLDKNHAIITWDANGVVNDTVKYNYIASPERDGYFMQNLRKSLAASGSLDANGRVVDANSAINIDQLDPSQFKLNMFSPDELYNSGKSSLVRYYGYDYLGNKTKGKSSIQDFLNSPSRQVGAFRPVYAAVFLQDQFQFKDLLIRVGVRVDRYDANQAVLKDPYSLYPMKTVREVRAENSALSSKINAAVSDDAYVYVNDVNNPDQITGYRTGNAYTAAHWFDKNGVEINDPGELARQTKDGRINPYLVDSKNQKLSVASFKDYKPKFSIMPRIWIRMPISRVSSFFANYDIYTQRPTDGNFSSIDDYYFLPQRTDRIINNPGLLPSRKTDYAIGFKQALGQKSAFTLTATYSELRNLIQVYKYNYAFPVSYTSFANIDFTTVKGMRAEYELHGKSLDIMLNYTLQYADGTGSGSTSGLNLVNSGQPNLRTVFPLDYDVRHNFKSNIYYSFSDTFSVKFLRNVGINLSTFAASGTPYSKIRFAVNEAQSSASRTTLEGGVNGNRLPWQFNMDMNIEKNFYLTSKKSDGTLNKYKLNVFMWVQNVLNMANPLSVYAYTGSANNDGYLSSANGRQQLENLQFARAFADMYNARINNPSNFTAPRQIKLGVRFEF
jgi:hypothetical protein